MNGRGIKMSDWIERINSEARIKHLDNCFGHHKYGFLPDVVEYDKKSGKAMSCEPGSPFESREKALKWIKYKQKQKEVEMPGKHRKPKKGKGK